MERNLQWKNIKQGAYSQDDMSSCTTHMILMILHQQQHFSSIYFSGYRACNLGYVLTNSFSSLLSALISILLTVLISDSVDLKHLYSSIFEPRLLLKAFIGYKWTKENWLCVSCNVHIRTHRRSSLTFVASWDGWQNDSPALCWKTYTQNFHLRWSPKCFHDYRIEYNVYHIKSQYKIVRHGNISGLWIL